MDSLCICHFCQKGHRNNWVVLAGIVGTWVWTHCIHYLQIRRKSVHWAVMLSQWRWVFQISKGLYESKVHKCEVWWRHVETAPSIVLLQYEEGNIRNINMSYHQCSRGEFGRRIIHYSLDIGTTVWQVEKKEDSLLDLCLIKVLKSGWHATLNYLADLSVCRQLHRDVDDIRVTRFLTHKASTKACLRIMTHLLYKLGYLYLRMYVCMYYK